MATEKLSMHKILDILRLHHKEGLSNRAIASNLGISAGTVSYYLGRARVAGISWPLSQDLNEEELYTYLFPKPVDTKQSQRTLPDLAWIHKELKRKGVTLLLLWYDYRSQNANGYSYSQFCEHYRRFSGKLKPSMRITHYAGEKLFVDYSGLTVAWVDKETGLIQEAEVFVAVLGASNYTYVEAAPSQSVRHWIGAHIRAFEFFGGVSICLVPDNLLSGVTKAYLYDPDTNATYQEMANHYSTAVIPARVRAPKDNAKV